jgi:hypothetical protein
MKVRLNPKYTANDTKLIGRFIVGREWKECDANVAKAAAPLSMGENAAFELSATVPAQPATSWPSPVVAAPAVAPGKVSGVVAPVLPEKTPLETMRTGLGGVEFPAPIKSKPGRKKQQR